MNTEKNFSITHIKSARDGKFGIEVGINGSHSDIGGGYHKEESEEYDTEPNQKALRDWLIRQGFYKAFTEHYTHIRKEDLKIISHYRAKRKVRHDIHKISLKMMRVALEHAIPNAKFQARLTKIERTTGMVWTEMGDFIAKTNDLCIKGWAAHPDVISLPIKTPGNLPSLRYTYVHWSAKYIKGGLIEDSGLKVRLDDRGEPYRKVFRG